MSTRRRPAPWLAAVVAAIVTSTVLVAPAAAQDPTAPEQTAADQPAPEPAAPEQSGTGSDGPEVALRGPGELTSILQPVSGVRDGAPTIIGGAVVNGTDEPVDVTVTIESADVSVDAARPSPEAPEDGSAWSCRSTECRLVDAEGDPVRLAPQTAAQLMLALSGPGVVSGASVEVRVGGLDPVDVPLDRADGSAPLGTQAIGLVSLGVDQLIAGSPSTIDLEVTNLGVDGIAPGSLVLTSPFAAADGVTVAAAGDSWSCDAAGTCSYDAAVAPLDTAAALQLTITPPAGAVDRSTLAGTAAATATAGGAPVGASTEVSFTVLQPAAVDVAVQLDLEHTTISAPDRQLLLGGLTALGTGPYPGPVVVHLDADERIRVDWDRAGPPERWDCDAPAASCTAIAPITADAVTSIELPVDVDADIEPGMYDLTLRAELPLAPDSDQERPSRENTQTLVVNPPPVAELRATLAAPDTEPSDGPLELHGDVAAPVDVVITNQGTRAAHRGAELQVELRPDGRRVAPVALDDAWTCTPGATRSVEGRRALTCTTTLGDDIAPGATLRVPLSFDTTDPGTTTWNVRSGLGDDVPDAASAEVEVVVAADGPVLSPTASVTSKLVRHGNGTLEVRAENRGRSAADGGVVVIDMTEDLTILGATGDGWNCVHAGFRGSNGSLTCATRATVEPGAPTSPLRVELDATTDRPEATVWLWSTTGGQAHPRSDRTGRSVRVDLRGTAEVDAGPDRTVISPVRRPDGSWQPADVTLHGEVDLASGHRVRWTQVGGPSVTWHDGDPAGAVATFTAPAIDGDADEPVALTFRLVADYDGRSVADDVLIRLVPPGSDAPRGASDDDRRTGERDETDATDETVVQDLGDPVAEVPDDRTPSSTVPPSTTTPSTSTTTSPSVAPSGNAPSGPGRSAGPGRQRRTGLAGEASMRSGRSTSPLGAAIARRAQQAAAVAPDQLCRAAAALTSGAAATVTGASGAIVLWIPAGTAAPRGDCGDATSIDVTGATLSLPGGTSVAIDGGVLDRDGLRIRNGQVEAPAGWKMPAARVPAGGLTLPFTAPATAPDGTAPAELSATSLTVQFVGVPAALAAKGSTSVTFGADGAELRGRSDAPAVVVSGRARTDGSLVLDVRRTGTVRLGGQDIAVSTAVAVATDGSVVESNSVRRGTLDGPISLDGGVTVTTADVQATPAGVTALADLEIEGRDPITVRTRLSASAADAAAGTWTVQVTDAAAWAPWGEHGPAVALEGSGTLRDGRLELSLSSAAVEWAPARHLVLSELVARIDLGGESPAVSFTGSAAAAAPGAVTGAPITGSLDLSTGESELHTTIDAVHVAAVELRDVGLTVHTDDTGATVGGSGSAAAFGAGLPATLELGADRALAVMDTDQLVIVEGWALDGARVAVSDVDTTYDGITLPAGRLIGVGDFSLPTWLRPEGMPDAAARGTARVDLTAGADSPTFHLIPEDASGWTLAGSDDATGSITVDDLVYEASAHRSTGSDVPGAPAPVDDADLMVAVAGTARLDLWRGTPVPVSISGALAAGAEGATMNLELRQTGPGSLPLGPSGAPLRDLAAHVDVGAAPTASVHALAALPGEVTGPLALPAGTERPVSLDLTARRDCLTVTLTDDAHAVDVGAAGLLVPTTALLAWGPEGCTLVDEPTTGTSLQLYDPVLGHVVTPLDPATLTGSSKSTLGQVDIGGVDLHDAQLTVTLAYGTAYLDVDATVPVDRGQVTVRGTATAEPDGSGRLHLEGRADDLVIGDRLTLRDASLSVDTSTTPGAGSPKLHLDATATILGTAVPLRLDGLLSAGAITSLTGSVASTRFPLPKGSLTTALQVTYDRSAELPVTITSVGRTATLDTGSRTWSSTAVSVDPTGIDVRTQALLAGSFQTPVELSGRYATAGSPGPDGSTLRAGDYLLRTVGTAPVTLDGFQVSATATFSRSGGTERSEQRAVLSLGLFDTDTPVTVSGPVDAAGAATLTGSVDDVSLRGLRGDVRVTVRPDASATGYLVEVSMATRPGSCRIWSNSPTLTGRVFRLDGGTVYELTGDATLKLPGGMDAAVPKGIGTRPLTLANTDDPADANELPAPGALLELGLTTPVFTAKVSAAFYLQKCAYTIAGEVSMQWGGGSGGSALGRSLAPVGGVTSDVTDQLNELAGGVFSAAALHSAHEPDLAAQARERLAAKLDTAAKAAQQQAAVRESALAEATRQSQLATAARNQASNELRVARKALASTNQQLAAARTTEAAVAQASLQVERARAARDVAKADADLYRFQRQEASTSAANAKRDAAAAAKRVTDNKRQEKVDERNRKMLSIRLAWTHCELCRDRDLMEIGGSLKFAVIYTAGLNLTVGINDNRFASALGTLSLGIEAPLPSLSLGPLKVGAEAGMSVYGTLGFRVGEGWNKLLFGVEGSAKLAVQMSMWVTTLKATIAGAKLVGEVRIIPRNELYASYKVEAFGLSKKGELGPWWP